MKRECKKLKREQQENEDAGNIAATTFKGNEVIFVCDDGHVNLTSQDTCWIVDSGASFNITSGRDFFSSYTSGDFGHVRMGNDNTSKIIGKGDVCLETNTGCHLMLKYVRHVPDMRLNLISTRILDEGYTSVFGDRKWKLSKSSLVISRGKKVNTLYVIEAKVNNECINALGEDSSV
jgi:hypothetical protein